MDDRDTCLTEGVRDLGFAQARGVVFKGQSLAGIVHVETAKAVEIGEFAEVLELFVAECRMEFVGDFEECHAGNYTSGNGEVASGEWEIERPKRGNLEEKWKWSLDLADGSEN